MKKLNITILAVFAVGSFVLLNACSSGGKKSSSKSDAAQSNDAAADAMLNGSNGSGSASTTSGKASALQDAIRSQNDEAVYKASTEALAINPADVKALNALALYHLRRNRPLAAEFLLNKAIGISSTNAGLHNNLGLTFVAEQEPRLALREFKKAVELNANSVEATGNLGSLYLHERDFKKAFVLYDMGYRNSNKDVAWMNNYAIVSAWHGNLDQAASLYQKALQVAPSNKEVLFNQAVLDVDYLHKTREGLDILDRIKVMGVPDSMQNAMNALENRAKAGLK